MLTPFSEMVHRNGMKIAGVLHVGAHDAQENPMYLGVGVPQQNIFWIEAIPDIVIRVRDRGIPNVINATISDKIETVEFNITNNEQSSSILPLKEHLNSHPEIHVVRKVQTITHTLDSIVDSCNIRANFLNMDIQGAELKCLRGFEKNLHMIDYIYTEVNEREMYAGCVLIPDLDAWLGERGFVRVETFMTNHGWGDALYLRRTTSSP